MSFKRRESLSIETFYKNPNSEGDLESIDTTEPEDYRGMKEKGDSNEPQNQMNRNDKLEEIDDKIIKKIQTKKAMQRKRQVIYALDCLIASIIVGPLVIAHWRGIWILMDFHQNIFSGELCFGLGICLHLLFTVLRQPLHEAFADGTDPKIPCARLGCRLLRTLYIYVFSLACNCHWRGAWILLNNCFEAQAGVIVYFTCAVLGNLIALRCMRNLLAPPLLITPDNPKFVFQFPTRYRVVSIAFTHYFLRHESPYYLRSDYIQVCK